MKAHIITTDVKGNQHIAADQYDLEDALISAKLMLKIGKATSVYIQAIGSKISWRVTKSGENYKLKGFAQPTI